MGCPQISLNSHDKAEISGYKSPVGQGQGEGDTLGVRINLLWSGHIAAET